MAKVLNVLLTVTFVLIVAVLGISVWQGWLDLDATTSEDDSRANAQVEATIDKDEFRSDVEKVKEKSREAAEKVKQEADEVLKGSKRVLDDAAESTESAVQEAGQSIERAVSGDEDEQDESTASDI